jgi:hypothetical protein
MVSFGDEDPTWLKDEGNSSCGASAAFKFKAGLKDFSSKEGYNVDEPLALSFHSVIVCLGFW